MKQISLIAAMALLPWLQSIAQVMVEVKLDQEQFLAGETLPVTVRVINRSGQTVKLGDDPEWLTFSVESRDDFIVFKNGDAPVLGEFALESSQMGTKQVDISPWFALNRQGRYSLTATVKLKDWGTQVVSGKKYFDIIDGAKIWSREFGVPVTTGASNQPPEVRKYTLEQANYLRSQLRLYLRLTDASESRIFKCIAIGPMVSFGQPDAQIDKDNNLHVLYQTGARSFSYMVYNPDAALLVRQTYEYANSRPRLQSDGRGSVVMVGGQRRLTPHDLPAPVSGGASSGS